MHHRQPFIQRTESTTVQSVLQPADVGNSSSSLLSVTYESNGGRSFPSLSFKSRIKAKFPTHQPETLGLTVAKRAKNNALPTSTLPPINQSRMIFSPVSLSPFLPNVLHPHLLSGSPSAASSHSLQSLPINYYRNRSIFSPSYNSRILPLNQRDFKPQLPVLITTTSTVRPKPVLTKGPILSNNATILPNDDYSIEAVIPVNLSAHFKLINSQQQQRVVLNNIQEIINSLKSEELREANETTSDRGRGWNSNQPANFKNGNFSAFKLRFLKKLQEHQNLMKGKNSPPSVNLTKTLPGQTPTEKRKQNSLKKLVNDSPTLTVKSASPENLFKVESYTLPKRNKNQQYHSTPSVPANRTQWQVVEMLMNKPVEKPVVDFRNKHHKQIVKAPLRQLNSNAYDDSQKKLTMKPSKSGRGEETDEGTFMTHLKDYLSKLVHKPESDQQKKLPLPASSLGSSSSQHLQMIIRSPVAAAAVAPVAGVSEANRIDYGEVERILAFVNPYGRRISMPNINTEYSSSLMAESRNVRLQRSAMSSSNVSEDLPLNNLLDQSMSRLNLSSQSFKNRNRKDDSWLDNLFEKLNNETQKRTALTNTSSDDPFDFISFPSTKSNYSREVKTSIENNDRQHYSLKVDADFKPNRIVKYGMRNSFVGSTQKPDQDEFNFGWKRPFKGEENMSTGTNNDKHWPSVYPKERFFGADQRRQLENISDIFRSDWLNYFEHLQQEMPRRFSEQNSDRRQFLPEHHLRNDEDRLMDVPPFANDQQATESFDGITAGTTTVMSSLPSPITAPPSSAAQLSVANKPQSNTANRFLTTTVDGSAKKQSSFEHNAKDTRERKYTGQRKEENHRAQFRKYSQASPMNRGYTPSKFRSYGHRINHPLLLPSMSDVVHYSPPVHPYHLSEMIQYSTDQPYETPFSPPLINQQLPPVYPHYHPPYGYY